MKKRKVIVAFTLVLSLFAACKKEETTPAGDNTPGGDTYQPLTVGSTWKYRDSISGSTYAQTVIDSSATFNNIKYQVMYSDNGTAFYAKSGSSYWVRSYTNPADPSTVISLNYLDDAAAAGSSWNTQTTLGGVPATATTSIVEKGISKTINGKTYSNVIHSRITVVFTLQGISINENFDYYAAKGIGIVSATTAYGLAGNMELVSAINLVDYTVK